MSVSRSVAVLVCWTLLLGAVAPPAVAGGTATTAAVGGQAVALPEDVAPRSAAITVVQANNTTAVVRHRNPDRRDEDGDLAAVRAHLAGEMGETIVDCSRAVGVGEFDSCEELNGSYDDALSKYVEVSRGSDDDGGDGTAREFRRARNESREYARTVREFRETYEEYREARESGDASRARRKARELRELSEETDRTGGNLSRTLRNVTRSGTDASAAGQAVNESTENVTRTVEGIERDLFVETETTARPGSDSASFLDPLVVTGRVTTANGTAVAGARVGLSRIRNGSTEERVRARTRTNETGHYRLLYRPVTVPAGSVPVAVRLLPAAESPYLPSNATTSVRVEQVRAELAVLSAPASTAYGDRLDVRVRVTTGRTAPEKVAVEGLPVTARLGEHRLGSNRTDGDGEAVLGGPVPAAVASGERTLVVGFEGSDQAVAPVTGSVEVDVRGTATALSATVSRANGSSFVLKGTLATEDGRPLAGQPVRVTLDGRRLGLLRTRQNGSFRGNLTVPAAVLPAEGSTERTVRLAFDGSGGNLASTEATVTVPLQATAASEGPLDDAELPLSIAAVLLVLVAGVVLLGRRRADGASTDARGTTPGRERTGSDDAVDRSAVLASIRTAMDAGDYDLVTTAGYRAVRRALADRVAAGPDATHWEFYGACAADGIDPERLEAIRRLTERFERVAFAPDDASQSTAAASLADAEAVLGHPSDGDGDGGDDGDGAVGSAAAGASRHGPS